MGVEAVLGEALQGAAGAGQGRRQPRLQVRVYPLLDQEGRQHIQHRGLVVCFINILCSLPDCSAGAGEDRRPDDQVRAVLGD